MIISFPHVRLVGHEKIRAEVSRSLEGDGLDPIALNCEFVRAVLWACTRNAPVHINRLLRLVVELALTLTTAPDEDATRGQLRRTLDTLAEVETSSSSTEVTGRPRSRASSNSDRSWASGSSSAACRPASCRSRYDDTSLTAKRSGSFMGQSLSEH